MNILISGIIFLLCYLPLLLTFSFMPYITRKTESFGISIPEEYFYNPEIIKLRKRYRNSVLISGIFIMIPFFILPVFIDNNAAVFVFLTGIFLLSAAGFISYIVYHRKMKEIKREKNWIKEKTSMLAADTAFRTKENSVSPFWFLLDFFVIAGTFILGIIFYDRIPAKVPLHYNLAGTPDGWAAKSFGLILYAPVFQIFLTIIMALVYFIIRNSKQQADASNPEESIEKSRIFRNAWSGFCIFGGLALVSVFSVLQLSFTGFITGPKVTAGIIFFITGIVLISASVLSFGLGQGGSRAVIRKRSVADKMVMTRDDDKYWKLGIFYYNPDDPAVFLEKRFGIGWTNNWARPQSWTIVLGLLMLVAVFMIISFRITGGK